MKRVLAGLLAVLMLATPAMAAVKLTVITSGRTFVFVNGVSLKKYDELAEKLTRERIGLKELAAFFLLKDKLYRAVLEALADAIRRGDSRNASKYVSELGRIEGEADMVLLKFLESTSEEETGMGWFDIYGNHRSFNCTDYYINPEFDFRLTDCRSDVGRSVVERGGTLIVSGVLMDRRGIGGPLVVKLVDPDDGRVTTLLYDQIGESKPGWRCNISWIGCDFLLKVNTTGLRPGVKELVFEYGNYSVSCCFRVS